MATPASARSKAQAARSTAKTIAPKFSRALACVDFVTIFHDRARDRFLRAIRPQIYAKGGDYTVESLNPDERGALREIGAEVKILPLVPGKSTTETIKKWKS